MQLHIATPDLELLLERKRVYIGNKETGWLGLLDALVLLLSAYTCSVSASATWEIVIKTTFCLLAIMNILIAAWQIHQRAANNYTKDMLLRDIEALDMTERRSSIIAIKNPANPRQYLVYYDPQWGYMLFPNSATKDYENERSIRETLARDLNAPAQDIHVQFVSTASEQKFATAHNEERAYEYYFYTAEIPGLPDQDFQVDARTYQWMTTDDLLADPQTREHNAFIIEHIARDC